jgi:hypothetical protein
MRDAAQSALINAQLQLYERLTPMASDFGGDAEAWALLQDLSERILAYEPFARLLDRHAAGRIDEARLPAGMARVAFRAFANTGRYERLSAVRRSVAPGTLLDDSLLWQEAAVLAFAGRDAEAIALLGERTAPRALALREFGAALRSLLRARSGDEAELRALRTALPPTEADLPTRALHGLALRRAGAHDAAEAITLWAEDQNPGAAFFATAALLAARPGADPLHEAWRAASLQPGNPLTAHWCFAATRADFAADYLFHLSEVPFAHGALATVSGTIEFLVRPDGSVRGEFAPDVGDPLPLRGAVDDAGNLEAVIRLDGASYVLLAKLAPPAVQRNYAPLAAQGQRFDLLRPDGLRRPWFAPFEG